MSHDTFTDDYIWGSGFTVYPWYVEAHYDEESRLLSLIIEDPDDEDKVVRYRATPAELWRTYDNLVATNPRIFSAPGTLFGTYDDIDLDAGDVDAIVQTLVLGDIVYG